MLKNVNSGNPGLINNKLMFLQVSLVKTKPASRRVL